MFWIWVALIIVLSLMVLFLYSACVISSRCSRLEEMEEYKNEKWIIIWVRKRRFSIKFTR